MLQEWCTSFVVVSFLGLVLGMLSLWVKKNALLWGSFLVFSLFLAYLGSLIEPLAMVPISALLLMHAILNTGITGVKRGVLFLLITAVSLCLFFPVLPWFHNWKIADGLVLGKDALPYSFWVRYDKPFVGFFILALHLPLIVSKQDLKRIATPTLCFTALGILLIMCVALYGKVVDFAPKLPPIFWLWPFVNLFLVCIPEEAFMRGYIQEEIFRFFGGRGVFANIACVLVASFFFALLHFPWVKSMPFLSLVFVAGIVYGGIYQYTKSIESSIFCHFALNCTHFFLFTYPALR